MTNCEIHGLKWEPIPSVRLCPKCESEHWHDKWMEASDKLAALTRLEFCENDQRAARAILGTGCRLGHRWHLTPDEAARCDGLDT